MTTASIAGIIAIDLPGYGLSDKPLDAKSNFTFYETILLARPHQT